MSQDHNHAMLQSFSDCLLAVRQTNVMVCAQYAYDIMYVGCNLLATKQLHTHAHARIQLNTYTHPNIHTYLGRTHYLGMVLLSKNCEERYSQKVHSDDSLVDFFSEQLVT